MMKQVTWIRVFVGAVLLLLSGAIGWATSDLYLRPVLTLDLKLDKAVLAPGEEMTYAVAYDRRKACKTQVERFVYAVKGPGEYRTYYRDSLPGLLNLGRTVTMTSIRLPDDLPSGAYRFLVQLVNYCSFVTRVDPYPEASFEVR